MRKFVMAVLVAAVLAGGCGFDGSPLINESIGTTVDDALPLSMEVKKLLRRTGQTASERIQVTTLEDDVVKLSGYVSDDATSFEAERLAGTVPGVRFVVNNLAIRR